MFKGLGNMAAMMKSAQEFQAKMGEMQESLKQIEVVGEAGAGMVKVTANGQQLVLRCDIEPGLIEQGDRELIAELVVAATNQALDKAKQAAADQMSNLTNGLNIPGLQDALSKFGQS